MTTIVLGFPNRNGTGPATLLAGPEVPFDAQQTILKTPGHGRCGLYVIEERMTVLGEDVPSMESPKPIQPKLKKIKVP